MDSDRLTWAIQATLITQEDSDGLSGIVEDQGMSAVPVYMMPFQDRMPDIPELDGSNGPVVFYGSTTLIELAAESGHIPGVWYDEDSFSYKRHVEINGDAMLNHDAEFTTLGEVTEREGAFFVRPLGDLKQFSGELVADYLDLYRWQEKLKMGGLYDFLDSPVIVAEPKNIESEHRCFVVDGKVADVTCYVSHNQRKDRPTDARTRAEIEKFLADIVMPQPCVVCDVAVTPEGLRVIEFNCLNASGFYGHDKVAIVRAISEFVSN